MTRAKANKNVWQQAEFLAAVGAISKVGEPLAFGKFPNTPWPEFALVGRSNVGKSSLLNALVTRHDLARVAKTPGRTQTINFFKLGENRLLVDLPGYGYAKAPPALQQIWAKFCPHYLTTRPQLKLALWLLDARHGVTKTDEPIQDLWPQVPYPVLPILTKADALSANAQAEIVAKTTLDLGGITPLLVSAKTGLGLQALRAAIDDVLSEAPPTPPPAKSVAAPPTSR